MSASLPALGTLLQPQVLVAGLLTGVIGGTVGVATGAIEVADPVPHNQVLYACPDGGRVVTSVQPDAKVLVVARSADGAWLELYVGTPGVEFAWAPVSALQLTSAPDSLPIDACAPEASAGPRPTGLQPPTEFPSSEQPTASAAPSIAPTTSPTPTSTATPAPSPTSTLAPTPTPLTGPVLSNLNVTYGEDAGGGLWRIYYGCSSGEYYDSFGFTVEAADEDGVASVTVHWDPVGAAESSSPMEEDFDTLVWVGFISPEPGWSPGPIHVWFTATDTSDNPGPVLESASEGVTFELAPCPPST